VHLYMHEVPSKRRNGIGCRLSQRHRGLTLSARKSRSKGQHPKWLPSGLDHSLPTPVCERYPSHSTGLSLVRLPLGILASLNHLSEPRRLSLAPENALAAKLSNWTQDSGFHVRKVIARKAEAHAGGDLGAAAYAGARHDAFPCGSSGHMQCRCQQHL
jgi:hypothetical protein